MVQDSVPLNQADPGYQIAKLEAILRSIGDGLVVSDRRSNVVLLNKAAADMLGWQIDEAVGKSINIVAPIVNDREDSPPFPDDPEESVLSFISTGNKNVTTYYLVRRDKTKFPAAITTSSVVLGQQVLGAVIVFRDITVEKEAERAKSDFIAIASHQLRTPLGSMKWNLEMLLNGDFGSLTGEAKEILNQILLSSRRMITLVNDLLSVSRIEQGRVYDQPESTDIVAVVVEAVEEIKPIAQSKQVAVTFEVPDQNIPPVVLDRKRFREVVANILSNSVKYNLENGKVIASLKLTDGAVLLSVSDTGIGIPKEIQSRMFSKFFRADNAISHDTEGTGLGLYVVKSYVESWGGKIWFESPGPSGQGTTFYIQLPLVKENT